MRKKRRVNDKFILWMFSIFAVIIFLTVGYSAFSDNLSVTGIIASIRADKTIRVTASSCSGIGASSVDYSQSSVISDVSLPAGESITYNFDVTNFGNTLMAISDVKLVNRSNQPISNLTYQFNDYNINTKICNSSNVCINNITKTISVTVTNNGSGTVNENLNINMKFSEVYKVVYNDVTIGEIVKGGTFNHTFTNDIPESVSLDGKYDTFNYNNNTLTIQNVTSDIVVHNAYAILYNGELLGRVVKGGTFNKNLEPKFPKSVSLAGTYGSYTYQQHILNIINVQSDIQVTGTIGEVEITRVSFVSSKNVKSHSEPTFHGMDASFSVVFQREEGSTEENFEIIYEVDLTNYNYDDYIFRGFDFNPHITASADSDTATLSLTTDGIDNGDVIPSEETKTFKVKLTLETNNPDGNYTTETNTQVDTTPDTEEEEGTITATVTPSTGDLRSPNELAEFTVEVTNTYPSERQFKLVSSNSNLVIVDSNGNALGSLTIPANTTAKPYTVYVKVADGATFVNDTTTMSMYLSTEWAPNSSVGTIGFNVDKYDVPDTTPISVGNASLEYYYDTTNKRPTIKATWDRIDVGGSQVTNYVATLYNSNGTVADTCETHSSTRSCLFSNVSENTSYYMIVYGIDEAQNSGASYVSGATTANGYATKSENASFKWTYSVTLDLTNLDSSGDTRNVILGASASIVISTSAGDNYTAPASPTVTMDGSSGTFYTYKRTNNNRTGTITIKKVTGNITVTGSREGYCLVKGTKILLADGTYKNIENIHYDDLLSVWNYDTGEITYTYPAFIEHEMLVYGYTKTTFDDGTTLKTYDSHAVFSYDLNRYILTTDTDNFKVGSKIVKIENGKVKVVTIKKIEIIPENVMVYHIVSNGYFNLIADDVLTTEPNIMISNQYGFVDNVKWPDGTREKIINNKNNLYTYDLFADIMPYYMFRALRVDEGKYVVDKGLISFDLLKLYLASRPANPEYFKDLPKNNNGKRLITITTSLDNVNLYNKYKYTYEEGSYYTLPSQYGVKCFLNTNNNTCYEKGTRIKVDISTHFIAVYN